MRDLASCFSEYSIQVSDASCSTPSTHSCIPPSLIPSTQNTVTCLYRTILQSEKQLLITVNWSKNNVAQGLTINLGDDPNATFKLNTNSRPFRKKKGNKSIELENSRFEILWDFSIAKYQSGPEPIEGYYILITVGSEFALVLGDMGQEAMAKKLKTGHSDSNSYSYSAPKFSLISRKEYFSGNTHYATRARFCESGSSHEILISCAGAGAGHEGMLKHHPVLSVSIDKKTVIRVKRLQWNFRGNQTIFIDGLLVDLMWDVHDWFFNPGSGIGVFMFRTRSGLDSRLWLEEKTVHKDQADKVEFSLLIYACKSL